MLGSEEDMTSFKSWKFGQVKVTRVHCVATQSVDRLRPLPDQHLTVLYHNRRSLLVDRLHRHGPHVRPRGRLTDRFRVVAIVLAALDEGLHVLRRDQLDPVTHGAKCLTPMMAPRIGFQSNLRRWQPGEKGLNLSTSQLPPQNDTIMHIHAVYRENMLRRVNRYAFKFHRNGPFMVVN